MRGFTGYETIKYGKLFYDYLNGSEKIIIYGAGHVCRQCLSVFDKRIKERIIGIAVSSMDGNAAFIDGIEVKVIDEFRKYSDVIIVIAIQDKEIITSVQKKLEDKNFIKKVVADYEKLDFYRMLDRIPRSKIVSQMEDLNFFSEHSKFVEKTLNIGKFLDCDKLRKDEGLKFNTLSMAWGGSSMLDYALLRGLVIKYQIDTYLEIGTYIGDSLTVVSDLVQRCYSITVPEEHPAHMKNWCHIRNSIDYSNKLVTGDNIVQYQVDSKEFDFGEIKENIGLYFIDGDHSYKGVLIDSLKVFEHFDPENNFIVWHDCKNGAGIIDLDVVGAIFEAAGKEYFENFFIFNNSMCGIYIPDKYLNDFVKATLSDKLMTYKVVLEKNEVEL